MIICQIYKLMIIKMYFANKIKEMHISKLNNVKIINIAIKLIGLLSTENFNYE